jgi:hypothetical protein
MSIGPADVGAIAGRNGAAFSSESRLELAERNEPLAAFIKLRSRSARLFWTIWPTVGVRRKCTVSTRTFLSVKSTPRWRITSIIRMSSTPKSKSVCDKPKTWQLKRRIRRSGSACGDSASCREHFALDRCACPPTNHPLREAQRGECVDGAGRRREDFAGRSRCILNRIRGSEQICLTLTNRVSSPAT